MPANVVAATRRTKTWKFAARSCGTHAGRHTHTRLMSVRRRHRPLLPATESASLCARRAPNKLNQTRPTARPPHTALLRPVPSASRHTGDSSDTSLVHDRCDRQARKACKFISGSPLCCPTWLHTVRSSRSVFL